MREGLAPLAITGMGVVCPFGMGAEAFWAAATSGRIAIRTVTRFDASGFMSDRAGEVDLEPDGNWAETTEPRSSRYAALAVGMALTGAGLVARPPGTSVGICAGTFYGSRPAGDRRRAPRGGRGELAGSDGSGDSSGAPVRAGRSPSDCPDHVRGG
jgi:3-oxoacyl-(acyl-carrier-protein) synthase